MRVLQRFCEDSNTRGESPWKRTNTDRHLTWKYTGGHQHCNRFARSATVILESEAAANLFQKRSVLELRLFSGCELNILRCSMRGQKTISVPGLSVSETSSQQLQIRELQ